MYKAEYHGAILLLRALHAYHQVKEPSTQVAELASKAMIQLRQLVILHTATNGAKKPSPAKDTRKRVPIKAAPAKTPARTSARAGKTAARRLSDSKPTLKTPAPKLTRKEASERVRCRSSVAPERAYDDLRRFTRLLGSLASLLALLGQVFAKVEVLKLIRAFQRGRECLVDDYVLRSAELATEYCKLGKQSRAGLVFLQAIRCVDESKREVAPSAKTELFLRYSAYLAGNGKLDQAYVSMEEF
jgi:uncharacterized protein YeeX (DUF496 family)